MLLFFKNWKELMILVSVFQLISCIAIPIAFTKLRYDKPSTKRRYQIKGGIFFSYFIFIILSFFLVKVGLFSLAVAFFLYLLFFIIYSFNYYKGALKPILKALYSSWTLFFYLLCGCLFAHYNEQGMFENWTVFNIFILLSSLNFWLLIKQKNINIQK